MSDYIERKALIAFMRGVRKRLPKDSKDFFTRDEMLLNFQQYVELQPADRLESQERELSGISGALREQQAREKECDYCGLIYKLDGASYDTDSVIIENRFCPMCGKRLEVEP